MNVREPLAAVLAMALALAMPAPAAPTAAEPATKTVIAEGVGTGADTAKARDAAIADAQRRAVEQAVGLFISTEAITANADAVKRVVSTKTAGYVAGYDIQKEGEQNGAYRVTICAQVKTAQVEIGLQSVWDRIQVVGSPRVIVAIDGAEYGGAAGLAQTAVTNKLMEQGYKVFGVDQLTEARKKLLLKFLVAGADEAADVLPLQDAADIVITGRITPQTAARVDDVITCSASLDVKAYATDTGEVICATRGKVTRVAFSAEQAAERAAEGAGEDWVEKNRGMLAKCVLDPAHDTIFYFTRCDYGSSMQLVSRLREMTLIRRARMVTFDGGLAQLDVQYLGTPQDLAAELQTWEDPRLEIEGMTANTIRVHAK